MICAQQYRVRVGNFNNKSVNFNMQRYNILNDDIVSRGKHRTKVHMIIYVSIIYLAIYNTASYDQLIQSNNNKFAHIMDQSQQKVLHIVKAAVLQYPQQFL